MQKTSTQPLCEIIYVASAKGWKWRAAAAEHKAPGRPCDETYQLFYECVTAARAKGYRADIRCR